MSYKAIVQVEDNRVAKHADFDNQADADAHVAEYGGFVYDNSAETPNRDLWVDAGNVVTVVPVVDPTDQELDEQQLNQTLAAEGSILRAVVQLLFEDRNDMAQAVADATSLASLKSAFPPVYTFDQFKTAIKNKMRT